MFGLTEVFVCLANHFYELSENFRLRTFWTVITLRHIFKEMFEGADVV